MPSYPRRRPSHKSPSRHGQSWLTRYKTTLPIMHLSSRVTLILPAWAQGEEGKWGWESVTTLLPRSHFCSFLLFFFFFLVVLILDFEQTRPCGHFLPRCFTLSWLSSCVIIFSFFFFFTKCASLSSKHFVKSKQIHQTVSLNLIHYIFLNWSDNMILNGKNLQYNPPISKWLLFSFFF